MNLLFVFADEMRAASVGFVNPEIATPTIDRLAREGVAFSRAYANPPCCTPSRGSLLTGRWPHRHEAIGNDMPIDVTGPALARSLTASGYRCGYIGKWHLAGVPRDRFVPPGPERLGFDAFWAAWNCHHSNFQPHWHEDTPEVKTAPDRYEPEVQTELALRFLEESERDQPDDPFCLFVSYSPPHFPYRPLPDGYEGRYDPRSLTLRPNCVDSEAERRDHADYYTHITAIDDELARLVQWLEAHGRLDDTLVVFSSDHGTMLGSHGRHYKQVPFDESIGIPLVMRLGDRLRREQLDDLLIGVVDLAPTLLHLLGVEPPPTMDGRNLGPHVLDPTRPGRPELVYLQNAMPVDNAATDGVPSWRGIRTDRYTYARTVDGPWLLFDNQRDPFQTANLVDDPEAHALVGDLDALLTKVLADVGDELLPTEEYAEWLGVGDRLRHRTEYFAWARELLQEGRRTNQPELARRARETYGMWESPA